MIRPRLRQLDRPFPPVPVNIRHPFAQGLVSWYLAAPGRFGGLKWFDMMGANHGALTSMNNSSNGFQGSSNRKGGRGGMLFDGTAGYITLGAPSNLNFVGQTNAFSITAWIKINGHPANNAQVAAKGASANANQQYAMIVNAAAGRFTLDCGNGAATSSVTPDVTDNVWHQLVMTVPAASTGMLGYVDGLVQSFTSGTGAIATGTTTNDVLIGARRDASNADSLRWFPGQIDDVRFYNRVLSASEIFQQYINATQGYPGLLNVARPGCPPPAIAAATFSQRIAGGLVLDRGVSPLIA
jgi:hypothetical protein